MSQDAMFVLMKLAEDQQKQLGTAIDKLSQLSGSMTEQVRRAAGDGARSVLEQATTHSANALARISDPMVQELKAAARTISGAEQGLQRVSAWMSWKWAGVMSLLFVSVGFAAYAYFWWLGEQTMALRAEISQLEANVADLAKRGGRIKLQNCGGRICVDIAAKDAYWSDTKTGAPLVVPKGY